MGLEKTIATSDELKLISDELESHPQFGEFGEILDRALSFTSNALEMLRQRDEGAEALHKELWRLSDRDRFHALRDPVLRDAVATSARQLKTNAVQSIKIGLIDLSKALPNSGPNPLRAVNVKTLGQGPAESVVWTDDLNELAWGAAFNKLFQSEIAGGVSSRPVTLRSPDEFMWDNLSGGYELLAELVPTLAQTNLAHVKLIAILDYLDPELRRGHIRTDLCQNVSTHTIPGTIFLSPSPLRSKWAAAEALLHEAAHKKLSDLVLTNSIFAEGYTLSEAPVVTAIWNRSLSWNPADWTIDRALFALHVYVHLAAFFDAAHRRKSELVAKYGTPGDIDIEKMRQGAIDRATYLATEIRAVGQDALGADGLRLVDWLSSLTAQMRLLASANLHFKLLMDRFNRETREIARIIRSVPTDLLDVQSVPSLVRRSAREVIAHIIHSELVSAFRILSTLGEKAPPTFAFYDGDNWAQKVGFAGTDSETLADWFTSIRGIVYSAIRNAPPGSESMKCNTRHPKTLLELVDDGVSHADRHRSELASAVSKARSLARATSKAN